MALGDNPLSRGRLSLAVRLVVVLFCTAVAPGQNTSPSTQPTQPAAVPSSETSQGDILDALTRMSVEQLMNVRITGVVQERLPRLDNIN